MKLHEKMVNKSKVKQIGWNFLRGLVLPVWLWQYLRFKRESSVYLKRIRAVQSFSAAVLYFGCFTLFVVYLPWSSVWVESAIARFFAWLVINGTMNRAAKKLWGMQDFKNSVFNERQIPLDILPDIRSVKVPGSSRAKYKKFPLGVKKDGSIFWFSFTDYVDGYSIEPFHIALYGEHGMYRENVAEMLIYRAVMVNARRSYSSKKWRFLHLFVPDIFIPYKQESNCIIVGLDDLDSGMSMQPLMGLPGVAVFTGRAEVMRAITKIDQICTDRNERTADSDVSIFVLCDHSVASAFLGNNPNYREVDAEMRRILVGGTKRKVKLLLIPPPNVTELIAKRPSKASVRAFNFHSKFTLKVKNKGLEQEVVKLPSPAAYPSLAYIAAPIDSRMEDVPVKIAHISPPLMRERLSKMILTPATNYTFTDFISNLPEIKSSGKVEEIEMKDESELPSGIIAVGNKFYLKLPDGRLKEVFLQNGEFFRKIGGELIPIKKNRSKNEPLIGIG